MTLATGTAKRQSLAVVETKPHGRERIYIDAQCDVPGYEDYRAEVWANFKELWRRRLLFGGEEELLDLLATQPFIRSWNLEDEDTGELLPVPHDNPEMHKAQAVLDKARKRFDTVRAEVNAADEETADLVVRMNEAVTAVEEATRAMQETQPLLRVPWQVSSWVIRAIRDAPAADWGKGGTPSGSS